MKEKNEIKGTDIYARFSLILGIAATVSNVLFVNYDGVPLSIAFAVIGIGCAIASKETSDDSQYSSKAKTGLVLSIIALVFGVLIFFIQLISMNVMTDPKLSRQVLTEFEKIIEKMPESVRPDFESFLQQYK